MPGLSSYSSSLGVFAGIHNTYIYLLLVCIERFEQLGSFFTRCVQCNGAASGGCTACRHAGHAWTRGARQASGIREAQPHLPVRLPHIHTQHAGPLACLASQRAPLHTAAATATDSCFLAFPSFPILSPLFMCTLF